MIIEFWKHEKYHTEIQVQELTGNLRAHDFINSFTDKKDNFCGLIYVGV